MNRSVANAIRFVMDECIPPVIRDSKWFMYPFFYIWFKGMDLKFFMNFKSKVYKLTTEEFNDVYRNIKSLGADRPSDTNAACIDYMLKNFDPTAKTLLDVGCGRGYWVNIVAEKTSLDVTGCDVYESTDLKKAKYAKGEVERLPFPDNSFDIVTCNHTIEHIINLDKAISELKRVARKQVIIVTPCQRFFYYTLDLHVNFFPVQSLLENAVKMENYDCRKISGDWVYIGKKS